MSILYLVFEKMGRHNDVSDLGQIKDRKLYPSILETAVLRGIPHLQRFVSFKSVNIINVYNQLTPVTSSGAFDQGGLGPDLMCCKL